MPANGYCRRTAASRRSTRRQSILEWIITTLHWQSLLEFPYSGLEIARGYQAKLAFEKSPRLADGHQYYLRIIRSLGTIENCLDLGIQGLKALPNCGDR